MEVVSAGVFRKNAIKLMSAKEIKKSLRFNGKSNLRVLLAKAATNIVIDSNALVADLSMYMLGFPFTQEIKDKAEAGMQNLGLSIVTMARILKVKTPSSTRKMKMAGTRGANLLILIDSSADLLEVTRAFTFDKTSSITVKRMINIPGAVNGAPKKEEREVEVVDEEKEAAHFENHQNTLKSILENMIVIYWKLCFDMFAEGPAFLFAKKLKQLQVENPEIKFELTEKTTEPKAKEVKVPEVKTPKKITIKKKPVASAPVPEPELAKA